MTERKEKQLRAQLAHLQRRYDAARRLGRRMEMTRLNRLMVPINVALMKIECPKRRKAA